MSENANATGMSESPAPKGDAAPANVSPDAAAPANDASTAKAADASGSQGESPEIQALRAKLGLKKADSGKKEDSDPKADTKSADTSPEASTSPTKDGESSTDGTSSTGNDDDVDTSASTGAALLARKDRALKAKQEKFAADLKAFNEQKADLTPVVAAREKLKSAKDAKERAAALLELAGAQVTIDDISELSALAGQERPALTEEDIDKRVQDKLEAAKKAEKEAAEKAEKEKQERITAGERSQVEKAAAFLAENEKKYPLIMFRGVSETRYTELMREGFRATGQIPSAELIYDYVEQQYRAEAKEKLGSLFAPPAAEPAKPSKTITADDKRGVTTVPEAKDDGDDKKPKEDVYKRIERRNAEFKKKLAARVAR